MENYTEAEEVRATFMSKPVKVIKGDKIWDYYIVLANREHIGFNGSRYAAVAVVTAIEAY